MKRMMKTTALLIGLLAMVAGVQAQKFGYLNSAAVLSEMPEIKQADSSLEALQKQLQKKGQQMVEDYQRKAQELQQKIQDGNITPRQQEEEVAKIKQEEDKIAQFEQDMMKQLNDKRTELMQPIYDRVNQAIKDVASENGYQFIFDSNVLLYAEESQDVSTLVKTKLGLGS